MRSTLAIVLAAALATMPGPAHAGRWESIESLPGKKPVTLLVKDKARNYFRIAPGSPLVLSIEGPTSLRIVSRAELQPGSKEVVSYVLSAREGNAKLDELRTESSAASLVRAMEGRAVICKARHLNVEIPAGRHEISLATEGKSPLLLRLRLGSSGKTGESMVSLTPIDAPRSVTVTEGERTIPYYTTFVGRPVRLRIVGPTVVDLITRLDFDATMRGPHAYLLLVSEKGRKIRDLAYTTTKTTTALYPSLRDRVPSKFDRTRLPIGEGVHELEIVLVTPEGGAAEIHARIPDPGVGSGE